MFFSTLIIWFRGFRCLSYGVRVSFLLLSVLFAIEVHAQEKSEQLRIVTLSPHLTEIVFALGKGSAVVAVSDYSDFPQEALALQSVASYEGANIAAIVRLQPTHILVWRGGNKDADIEKLKALNAIVHESSIDSVSALLSDIERIGVVINAKEEASALVDSLNESIASTTFTYKDVSKTAIYYFNPQPLMGLGNDSWLNSLLALCNINNLYKGSPSAYMQLQLADILRQQPDLIIAASQSPKHLIEEFWAPHRKVLTSPIALVNPDALHRFTPRAILAMNPLCKAAFTPQADITEE